MVSLSHLKRRLGQYGATWVIGFLLSGVAILIGSMIGDMIAMTDIVLPIVMVGVVLALGTGVVMTWLVLTQTGDYYSRLWMGYWAATSLLISSPSQG